MPTRAQDRLLGQLGLFVLLSACSTAANSAANSQGDSPGNNDVVHSTNTINRSDDLVGSTAELNDLLGKEVNGESVTTTTEGVAVVRQDDNRYYIDTSKLAAGEHRVVLVESTASGGTITHYIDLVIDPAPRWATPETAWTITRGADFAIVLPDANDNGTVAYEVVDLPEGWSFDNDTRALSGVYEGGASTLSVAYVADDGYSKVVRVIDLEIAPAPPPPVEPPAPPAPPEIGIDAKAGEHWEVVYAFDDDVEVRLRDKIISPLQLVDASGEVVYDKGGVYDPEQNAIVWRIGFADDASYNVQVAPDNGIYDTLPGELSHSRVPDEAVLGAVGSSVMGHLTDEDEVDSYVAYLEA
ncbi:MAG: hypothetical protein K0U36_02475, partial [Alphaproteobacteria bacterium]|nr:hypothetical protein [Alphaproteobacteria bacterium]